MLKDDLGAKAPSSSSVCSNNDFLTLDMIKWYYGDGNTVDVEMEKLNDREMVIIITEIFKDTLRIKRFTIGQSIKKMICNNYNFYHNPNNIG